MPNTCNCDGRAPHRHCGACGIILQTNLHVTYNGQLLCWQCYAYELGTETVSCWSCARPVVLAHGFAVIHRSNGQHVIHTSCVGDTAYLYHCDECGTYSTGGACRSCHAPGRVIHDYNFSPPTVFMKNAQSSEELFLGIELEIDRCNERYGPMTSNTAAHTQGLSLMPDWCYAKYDSSIQHGFEIVTQPMSVNWVTMNIHTLVDKFGEWRELGYRSGDVGTCGMHVHMSKIAFTHAHLYKFMYLVYAHPSFSLLLSQRTMASFERWAFPFSEKSEFLARAKTKLQGARNRHDAVNISTKPTVELRIFAGTLNPLTFNKNLDVTLAMYRFSQDTSLHAINVSKFVEYVYSNRSLYPYLFLFFSDKESRSDLFSMDTPVIPEKYVESLSRSGMI